MYAPLACIVSTLLFSFSSALLVSVDTPLNAVACSEIQLNWEGGIDPWTLSFLSALPPNELAEELEPVSSVPVTWVVDVGLVGTKVILQVNDSTGNSGKSSAFFIEPPRNRLLCGAPIALPNITISPPNGVGGGPSGSGTGDGPSSSPGGPQDPPPSQGPDTPPSSGSPPPTTESSPTGTSSVMPTAASPATLAANSFTQSVFTANSDSAFFASTDPAAAQGSPVLSSADLTGGGAGQQQPAITILSTGGNFVSSGAAGLPEQTAGSNNLSQKKAVMSGPIIGGIVAAVLCVMLAALCVVLRCRRRRPPDTTLYPFTAESSEHSTARVTAGRTGYPPSAFSSWGNNGNLADEYARSPTEPGAPILIPDSTEEHVHNQPAWEGQPAWGAGQGQSPGPMESGYAADAFIPRHIGASSSIDRNDPTSHQRFRGPMPKAMIDAYRAGPSNAPRDQGYSSQPRTNGTPVIPETTSSWREARELIVGSRQPVVGVPPPYTSR